MQKIAFKQVADHVSPVIAYVRVIVYGMPGILFSRIPFGPHV